MVAKSQVGKDLRSKLQLGAWLSLLILLAGCASPSVMNKQTVRFPSLAASVENPDQARIYVLRPPGDGTFTLLLKDGPREIGTTTEGSYLCWEREPGNTTLASVFDGIIDTLDLHVEKNRVYYVRQKIALRVLGHAHTRLEPLSGTEGRELLKKCHAPIAAQEVRP